MYTTVYPSFKHFLLAVALLLLAMALAVSDGHAQDTGQADAPKPAADTLRAAAASTQFTDGDYTVWRSEVNSGCQYEDHDYTLEVTADPQTMSDISFNMTNLDVDYNDPQFCEAGPEVDKMRFNSSSLGILTGANSSWSVNSWPLAATAVRQGANQIHIDTDAPGTGCWCVGVGYVEVRAKVDFAVEKQTPLPNDRNRDFHKDKVDLSVTFSSEYDDKSLTPDTFKLEYRDQKGQRQPVAGDFKPFDQTPQGPKSFRFVPSADLKDGVRYYVTLKGGDKGVKSVAGGKLKNDAKWEFWTVPDLNVTDNFDYGKGSVCPPSTAPCLGLELTIFQVARNAPLIPLKPTMARLYLRWKDHPEVHKDDQMKKDFEVDVLLNPGGKTMRARINRPDQYSDKDKAAAKNTVNLYDVFSAGTTYGAQVTPYPQTNSMPVKFAHAVSVVNTGVSPVIRFKQYFLKGGSWRKGVPEDAQKSTLAFFDTGTKFTTAVFPVLSTQYTSIGIFTPTYTTTMQTLQDKDCGIVQQVLCPSASGPVLTDERTCIESEAQQLLSGNDRFVAITAPADVCPKPGSLAYGKTVFLHLYGQNTNTVLRTSDQVVAHEIGHLYGISTANTPTSNHRNDSRGVEGFQVATKTNRSFTENPKLSISLMYTVVLPSGVQWIHNDDYMTLIGALASTSVRSVGLESTTPSLSVAGFVDLSAGSATLLSAYLQDSSANESPVTSGTCLVELVDAAGASLASRYVTPGADIIPIIPAASTETNRQESMGFSPLNQASGEQYFNVRLPWDEHAQRVRLTCNGVLLASLDRSPNPPTVDFIDLADGASLNGIQTIRWTGNDADGANPIYQLQVSEDRGATWMPLVPLQAETHFDLDTTWLSSGPTLVRVLATDGFNTSYAVRSTSIANPLKVAGVFPSDGAIDVDLNESIEAVFVSGIITESLYNGAFGAFGPGGGVTGAITYDVATHRLRLTPDAPLQPSTTYTAFLNPEIAGVNGGILESPYTWRFTTISDTVPPAIVRVSPVDAALDVPLNALVQAQFNEAMDATTMTGTTFQVLDGNNTPVAGGVSYDASTRTLLFTPAVTLTPTTTYMVQVTTDVADLAGNRLETPYTWSFTTGTKVTPNGLRILDSYVDQAFDQNGDGLYDKLTIFTDVEVMAGGEYNLNGRLTDKTGALLDWTTTGNKPLNAGVHTLALTYNSVPLRSNGVDGPYFLGSLNFYNTAAPELADTRIRAYQTFPYTVTQFYSALTLGGLPDQQLEINSTRDNAFNLRNFTTHATRPITDVTYTIFINTDPTVGVTLDGDANIDINPPPDTEAESDVTIEAKDALGNRVLATFHVSVQKARARTIQATTNATIAPQQSQPIMVELFDQWERRYTVPVTLTFVTTLGAVTPMTVTTTTGAATVTFVAGDQPGAAFVTIGAEAAITTVRIDVTTMATATPPPVTTPTGTPVATPSPVVTPMPTPTTPAVGSTPTPPSPSGGATLYLPLVRR